MLWTKAGLGLAVALTTACATPKPPPTGFSPAIAPIPGTANCEHLQFADAALWTLIVQGVGWLPVEWEYTLARVDARRPDRAVTKTLQHGEFSSLIAGEGAVWASFFNPNERMEVTYKIDPATMEAVGSVPTFLGFHAVSGGAVWAGDVQISRYPNLARTGQERLVGLDADSLELTPLPLSQWNDDAVFGAGALWLRHPEQQTISRVDPHTFSVVRTITPPPSMVLNDRWLGSEGAAHWMAFGSGSLWVFLGSDDRFGRLFPTRVGRLDPATNEFVAVIEPRSLKHPILADIDGRDARVWVLAKLPVEGKVALLEIDHDENTIAQRLTGFEKGSEQIDLAVGDDAVWVCLPSTGIYHIPFGSNALQPLTSTAY
jgi:hypothetical protein